MLLELEQLGKSYFTDDLETRALRDISLEIETGEYVTIEGPSGCGKTTLLSILGLLDSPTMGSYRLNGTRVDSLSENERAHQRNRAIGFIFQSFNLLGDMTVEENIELPLVYRGVTKIERRRRVTEVLGRVGITQRRNHYPSQLSGGQQQRVAVARAFVGEPLLLLADEPTGNLDSKNGESVMDLLADLHSEGSTILMVTHDHRFSDRAERKIQLLDGRLVNPKERPIETN